MLCVKLLGSALKLVTWYAGCLKLATWYVGSGPLGRDSTVIICQMLSMSGPQQPV